MRGEGWRSAVVAVAAGAAALATSCGDEGAAAPVDGGAVFADTCAGCHGTDGDGSVGPSLLAVADRYTVDEQEAVIRGGRGRMPAFDGALTDAEIDAVVAYTREELG